jgi:hypothetical protein
MILLPCFGKEGAFPYTFGFAPRNRAAFNFTGPFGMEANEKSDAPVLTTGW